MSPAHRTDETIIAAYRAAQEFIDIMNEALKGRHRVSFVSTDHLLPILTERFEFAKKYNESLCSILVEDSLKGVHLWDEDLFTFSFAGMLLSRMEEIKGRARCMAMSPGDMPIPNAPK